MIGALSDLLRQSVSVGPEEISLREELQFMARYVELQRIRFEDRLRVSFSVDPTTLDARVPSLLLQPLLENAVRYGVAARSGLGHIDVTGERDGAWLLLSVRDDGLGLPRRDGAGVRTGVGLGSTRARLRHLYGDRYYFELQRGEAGGAVVVIRLPLHTHDEHVRNTEDGNGTASVQEMAGTQ
jgi:sensor histidine kinase YesM